MTVQKPTDKKPRVYRKIDARTVSLHQARTLELGNGSRAVREFDSEYLAPGARSHEILKKAKSLNVTEYIDTALEQMGEGAISRVNDMIYSTDERIATKNSHYIIDHIRGKAVQRSINVTAKLNIQSVLD